jgi:hypothetical protein
MNREVVGDTPGPAEVPPEEPDEHAWHLGIGAPTIRTWLMADAGDDETPEVEEYR